VLALAAGAALWFGGDEGPARVVIEPASSPAPEPRARPTRPPAVEVDPEPPPELPTLERPEVHAAFGAHVAEVLPHWERVSAILAASTHPDLRRISDELAGRLVAAQRPGVTDRERQDLIHEERQLLNHLRARYAGFQDLEAPLEALDAAVTALDGG